jgi:hypothetical protein
MMYTTTLWYTRIPVLASTPLLNMVPSGTGFIASHVCQLGGPPTHPPIIVVLWRQSDMISSRMSRSVLNKFLHRLLNCLRHGRDTSQILHIRPAKVCSRIEGLEHIIGHVLTNAGIITAPGGGTRWRHPSSTAR